MTSQKRGIQIFLELDLAYAGWARSILRTDTVLGIVNPFSWIFNAVSSEKSYLISMPFLLTYIDVRIVNFFPPAESWLVKSHFPRADRMQDSNLE